MPPVLLQPYLSQFFENLPYLPFLEVSKHLGPCDLIKLSFLSDNWKEAILKREWKELTRIDWKSESAKSELSISFDANNRYNTKKTFEIQIFHEETLESAQMSNDGSLIIHSRAARSVVNRRILETCHFWSSNFQFYLGDWNSVDSLWMTRSDLMKVDFHWVNFNSNRFNSRDFNILLHHWVNGLNEKALVWKFPVSVDHVKIEDVLRGLWTERWDPKSRDRQYSNQEVDGVYLPPIDLQHGFDIYSSTGKRATVQIIENVLHFCGWFRPFSIVFLDELLVDNIKLQNRILTMSRLIDYPGREENVKRRWELLQSLRNIRGDQALEVEEIH